MPTWRLLLDDAQDGARNMGVDEALLATAVESRVATFRFYHWTGPWLSLGYAQRHLEFSLDDCTQAGVGVVRRVTGGGAVLHGCDLTYCLAAPEDFLPPGLHGSYGLVASAMLEAFAALGVHATRKAPEGALRGVRGFDCFALPVADEICAENGRKLVGSAQRRAGGGVLQHGSIRLTPDPEFASAAAGVSPRAATSLCELGVDASVASVREALLVALGKSLDADFRVDSLTENEQEYVGKRVEDYRRNPLILPRAPRKMLPQAPRESADTNP